MNLARARRVLWASDEARQRIAELQDLCRVLIEDAEKSDVVIAELKAELAKFHPCDEGQCMIDESTHEYKEAEEHPFKVWHREEAGDGLLW